MADLLHRPKLTTSLILLGMVLSVIGLHGYNNIIGTQGGCLPVLSALHIRVIEMTLQTITYEQGCNYFFGPTYAVLWPVGLIAILLGGGLRWFDSSPDW